MKILLFGANGQVGRALREALAGHPLIALGRGGQGALAGDLEDLSGIRRTVQTVRPEVVINAAAYTDVDGAEAHPEQAWRINAEAPGVLAEAAREVGARLVHYSTDYVFDGSGTRPWQEDDPTGPVNAYGRSKLGGEQAVRQVGGDHFILRVSWVHHEAGKNFIRTLLHLAQARDRLEVVADQIGAPTPARLIARITRELLEDHPQAQGIYHLTPQGETSWCDYARHLVREARARGWPMRLTPQAIHPTTTEAFGAPAPRPKNSRLDTTRLCQRLGRPLPPWQDGVAETLARLQPEEVVSP